MCGIVGVVPITKNARPGEWLLELLKESEIRGDDATGFVRLGLNPQILKANLEAEKFIELPEVKEAISPIAPYIGHCRKTTCGMPENNLNNHPLWMGGWVAVHNGTVQNKVKETDIPGFVDSRWFPYVLETCVGEELNPMMAKFIVKVTEGTFAISAANMQHEKIYILREDTKNREVYLGFQNGCIYWTQMKDKGLYEVPPEHLIEVSFDGDILEWDLSRTAEHHFIEEVEKLNIDPNSKKEVMAALIGQPQKIVIQE